MRIHCLGGGLVGSFVTRKLHEAGMEVHLYDIVERETPATLHLGNASAADHSAADSIVNMVPGSIGHRVLNVLHQQGHRIVDLSFSETTPDNFPRPRHVFGTWALLRDPNMLVALPRERSARQRDHQSRWKPSGPDAEWSYMALFPHDVIAEHRPAGGRNHDRGARHLTFTPLTPAGE